MTPLMNKGAHPAMLVPPLARANTALRQLSPQDKALGCRQAGGLDGNVITATQPHPDLVLVIGLSSDRDWGNADGKRHGESMPQAVAGGGAVRVTRGTWRRRARQLKAASRLQVIDRRLHIAATQRPCKQNFRVDWWRVKRSQHTFKRTRLAALIGIASFSGGKAVQVVFALPTMPHGCAVGCHRVIALRVS